MEAIPVDSVRNDVDGRKSDRISFPAQPAEGGFKLIPGKLRVDDDPIRTFKGRDIVLIYDPAVERDIADDLQPVALRPKDSQIVGEIPDVVENKNEIGIDLFNQCLRVESRKDIAAFQIGRMKRQTTIADGFPRKADTQIVNLMAVREPPHDAVHHPRQSGAAGVEADGDEFHAGSRFAKNRPSPSSAPSGLLCLRQVTVNPALPRKTTSASIV